MISYVRMTQGKIFKVRDVASVVGQVILLTPCVGSVARIMTRALYTVVNQKQSWNSKVELTKEACDELTFWIDNVDSLNFRCPWLPFQPPARFVYSDASDYACSSFIENEHKIFHQNWSATEGSQSSTWRELRTVDLALSAFAPDLQGKKVAWFTDNTSVVSIVHNGSRVEELQSLALSIFHVCASSVISLEMKWIPRDSLSRITINLTITLLMMTCFICWIVNGGPTQWIGLPVVTTPSFRALILDFTNPALKLWTLSPRTGREKIIGSIHRYRKLVELLLI